MRDAWRTVLVGPVQAALDAASKEAGQEADRLALMLRRKAVVAPLVGRYHQAVDRRQKRAKPAVALSVGLRRLVRVGSLPEQPETTCSLMLHPQPPPGSGPGPES